ncbi:MAG TPA: Hsp20/alpha crystallin family protein [Longimicrobiaceae bacterium]|nr:Hsp20/alpha crystallin family protein [Longimicrobiaceae bacterium]
MAITPYRPTTELFRTFFDDMPGLGAGPGGRLAGMDLLRAPNADVMETKDDIHVTLELPGLRPEDIDVNLEDNVLTISGEKKEEREGEGPQSRWHLSERRYGRFSRTFVLPKEVEQDRIQARFENGILNVTIPKSERVKPRRLPLPGGTDYSVRRPGSCLEAAGRRRRRSCSRPGEWLVRPRGPLHSDRDRRERCPVPIRKRPTRTRR